MNHHLAGKLHASGAEVEPQDGVPAESSDAAVKIASGDIEEEPADVTEDGVAEISVERGHGSGLDLAAEAVAHDEIVAGFELDEEAWKLAEVVARVGVGHKDVFAACGFDAGEQCGSVAADRDGDDARAFVGGDLLGAIGASVVGDDDFPRDIVVAECGNGLPNAKS